jgi:hypothetical protein
VLSNFIKSLNESKGSSWKQGDDLNSSVMLTAADLEACIADSCKVVTNAYWLFKNKAHEQVMEQDYLVCSASYIRCLH